MTKADAWSQAEDALRDELWKIVDMMANMGPGACTVGPLLPSKLDDPHGVQSHS